MRIGHEVIEAQSKELSFLYGDRAGYGIAEDDPGATIPHSLPPSPATMKDFIGRRYALDRLYQWLLTDDEPRTFLYGKGGSGKSTIAYEFARIVSESCGRTATKWDRPIDYVLFLGAKRKSLDPTTGKVLALTSYDFEKSEDLFRAILELTEWMSLEEIKRRSGDQIVKELTLLFDTAQVFLIVDDIDTLTTAGIDPGMDTLYRLMSRSKSGGKVLYTLRNAPSQSLSNAIEVPGLDLKHEYREFVTTCCAQFKVPPPDDALVFGQLAEISERRPLALEVVVGLRRTAGRYDEAIRLFEGKDGEAARRYLFQREYDGLSSDNKSRLFLSALSLLGRAVKFSELKAVLQFSPEQVRDCVSETLEMFLQSEENAEGETLYRLGQATDAFIRDVSPNLLGYEKLKANVKYFKSPFLPKNIHMAQMKFQIQNYLGINDLASAYDYLCQSDWSPIITQHPEYNLLRGQVCTKWRPPKYDEARQCFKLGIVHGASNVQAIRDWYWMEFNSGFNNSNAIEVCDHVISGKGFPTMVRSEFYSKKGSVLSRIAQSAFYGDPEISFSNQRQAIDCFLEGRTIAERQGGVDLEKVTGWLYDSFRYFLISVNRMCAADRQDLALQLVDFMKEHARSKRHKFDVVGPVFKEFAVIVQRNHGTEAGVRNRALLHRLLPTLEKTNGVQFSEEAARTTVLTDLRRALAALRE